MPIRMPNEGRITIVFLETGGP